MITQFLMRDSFKSRNLFILHLTSLKVYGEHYRSTSFRGALKTKQVQAHQDSCNLRRKGYLFSISTNTCLKNVGHFKRATFNSVLLLKEQKQKKHAIINLPVSFSKATPVNKISIFLCEREFTCSNGQNWMLRLKADVFHLNKSGCTKEMAGLLWECRILSGLNNAGG